MLECIGKMKKNSMKTFSALIPLRIGSKGIPKKNIKYDYDLNGRRLHPLAPKRKTKNIGMHLVPKTAILK